MTDLTGGSVSQPANRSSNDFSVYVLPLSILLASVILGYSMMTASGNVATGLAALTITGAAPAGDTGSGNNALPTPDPGQGNLAPTPSKTMAELASSNYAAKLGKDDAPIVLVEYSDGQCPFCRRFALQTFPDIVQNYVNTGKVQVVYKHFPLSFHPMAPTFAEAMSCAGDEGKFWEMKKAVFDKQQAADPSGGTVSTITADDVKAWAKELGLNEASFNSCLDSKKFDAEIQANQTEGTQMGVRGTPSFILGKRAEKGQLIVGAQPTASFTAAIDQLLA